MKGSLQKILITGASGCIGRAFTRLCVGRQHRVRAVARTMGTPEPGVDWVEADLLGANMNDLALGCDAVVHLAALVHQPVEADREAYFRANVAVTEQLLRAAIRAGIAPGRFVLASTTAVYGARRSAPLREDTPCTPATFYGQSKLAAERIVLNEHGLVIRFPLVYGPGDRGNFGQMARAIARNRFVIPTPDLPRSLVSSRNAAEMLYSALSSDRDTRTYLVSDDHDLTVSQIVSCVRCELPNVTIAPRIPYAVLWPAAVAGTLLPYLGLSSPLTLQKLHALTRALRIDCGRAKAELDYQPAELPEAAIRRYVRSDLLAAPEKAS